MSLNCLPKIEQLISIFDIPLDTILKQWVNGCYTDYPLRSIRKIRKVSTHYTTLKHVIDSGVVTQIMKLLQNNNYNFEMLFAGYMREFHFNFEIPAEIINYLSTICSMDYWIDDLLQQEGRWVLINISSSTSQTIKYIIDNGAIPLLANGIKPLHCPTRISIQVLTYSIHSLGNIACDCAEYRDLILSYDVLPTLCSRIVHYFKTQRELEYIELFKTAAWALRNMWTVIGEPALESKYVDIALQALRLLITSSDTETLENTCCTLQKIVRVSTNHQRIINSGILSRIMQLLTHENSGICLPALQTIGNIVTGSDQHTQHVINLGVVGKLYQLLKHDKAEMRSGACWTLSNIAAGSNAQIECVIAGNVFPAMIHILNNDKYEVAKEALWAISNATSGGTDQQITYLVQLGAIPALCDFFKQICCEMEEMSIVLEAIGNILAAGKRQSDWSGPNKFVKYVEQSGGVAYLKRLQSNQEVSDEIYDKVNAIMNQYFNCNNESISS